MLSMEELTTLSTIKRQQKTVNTKIRFLIIWYLIYIVSTTLIVKVFTVTTYYQLTSKIFIYGGGALTIWMSIALIIRYIEVHSMYKTFCYENDYKE